MHTDKMYGIERSEHQAFQKLMTKPLWPIQHHAGDVQASGVRPNRELRAISGIANQQKSVGGSLIRWFVRRWITLVNVNRQAQRWRVEQASARTPAFRCYP